MLNLRPARNQQRSLASLDAYQRAEAARVASKSAAAASDGDAAAPAAPAVARTLSHSASFDVEYEALALRVAPPEVRVDNAARADATLVTVDSANRAGTLVAVAQFLTEKRLNVRSARITSDYGWFYDGGDRVRGARGRGARTNVVCPGRAILARRRLTAAPCLPFPPQFSRSQKPTAAK